VTAAGQEIGLEAIGFLQGKQGLSWPSLQGTVRGISEILVGLATRSDPARLRPGQFSRLPGRAAPWSNRPSRERVGLAYARRRYTGTGH